MIRKFEVEKLRKKDDHVGSKRLISGKKAMTLTIAVMVGLSLCGCNKQLAKWDIDSAKTKIEEAKKRQADVYTQSQGDVKTAEDSLRNAQNMLEGDAAEAKNQAKQAVTAAKSALSNATAQFAADMVTSANTAMEVAAHNDAPMESPALYEKAQKAQMDMQTANEKQKFEKVIARAQAVQTDVDILVAAKKSAADSRFAELSDLRNDLSNAKAAEYNLAALTTLDEDILGFRKLILETRHYKKAFNDMEAKLTATHEAIAETKRRNANDLLQQAQVNLDDAMSEEADVFATDNLKAAQTLMTETLAAYYDKQYDAAIQSAEKLREDSRRVVYQARIENTRDKVSKVEIGINKLQAQTIEKYIDGRIEGVIALHKKAAQFFANNDFQSAKQTALEALEDIATLNTVFNDLAAVEVEKATGVTNVARKTFTKMTEVFASEQLWASAEARRLMEEANLGARLEEVEKDLKKADANRVAKAYRDAIEIGKLALSNAQVVEADMYGVSARYTLLRVQNELTELERQNALNLAPVQVAQVAQYVVVTQSLINEAKMRDAVEAAACARAGIENVKQEMTRRATQEQNRADQMIRRLETADTRDGQPGGSDINNREAMALEGGQDTSAVAVTDFVPAAGTTNNPLAVNASAASYEAPTQSAPFVAVPANVKPDSVKGLWDQVETLIGDEHRIQNIKRYSSSSIGDARTALQESQRKMEAHDYNGAYEAATRAQRTILEAESRSARRAAQDNLGKARSRMNLAKQAGSALFAPNAMIEASNLITEAQRMINAGNNNQAYEVSVKALDASDSARLYNVNKARETGALALRYGGNMSQHALLTDSQTNADLAEKMLATSNCALQGQEVAKLAVYQAQLALDHARDWTFQERLDNIYKALNTATRAGGNWFNPVEIKRLMDELGVARKEYNTRNFDAVEIKLNDIEAGLARVIETTPQILEQNVSEQTNRLNALLDAGAENYAATTIDDAKSMMNYSVIDFRNEAYGSSYHNIADAVKKVDEVEAVMQEQVYFDAVTELFDQLDDAFVKFSNVTETGPAFLKRLVASPTGARASVSLAGRTNPNNFFDTVNDIYKRGLHLAPPASQKGTQEKVLLCLKYARTAAGNFQKLYVMDQFDARSADEVITVAYEQLNTSKKLRAEIQFDMIEPEARRPKFRADKIVNY